MCIILGISSGSLSVVIQKPKINWLQSSNPVKCSSSVSELNSCAKSHSRFMFLTVRVTVCVIVRHSTAPMSLYLFRFRFTSCHCFCFNVNTVHICIALIVFTDLMKQISIMINFQGPIQAIQVKLPFYIQLSKCAFRSFIF